MKLALVLIGLLLLAAAFRLGEPALPKCPHGRTAHERCLP